MTKFLNLACVYLCFTLGMQFFNETTAQAREVFAFSVNGIDHYVETSSFERMSDGCYYVGMHCYPPGDLCITNYTFFRTNHGWACNYTTAFPSLWNSINSQAMVYRDWKAQAVFNIVYHQIESSDREAQRLWEEQQRRQEEERRLAEEKRRRQEEEKRRKEQRIAAEKRREAEKRQRIETERKNVFNSLIAQGDSSYIAKNYVAAISNYDEAKNVDKNSVDKFFDELVKNGDRLNSQGNYSAAQDYYKKAVTMNPLDNDCRHKLWETYSKVKNLDDAVSFYEAVTKVYHEDSSYWFALAYIYYELKDYEKAVTAYTNSLEFSPNSTFSYNYRGVAYSKLKQNERAIQDYNKAIELNPNYATAYFNRGFIYEQLKKYKKALKDYQKALKLTPNDKHAKQGIERLSKMK